MCPKDIREGLEEGKSNQQVHWTLPENTHNSTFPLNTTGGESGELFHIGFTTVTVFRQGYQEFNCSFTITLVREYSFFMNFISFSEMDPTLGCKFPPSPILLMHLLLYRVPFFVHGSEPKSCLESRFYSLIQQNGLLFYENPQLAPDSNAV